MKISVILALVALSPLTVTATPHGPCPKSFYQLPLTEQASLCNIYNDALPASLSFHVKQSPAEVQAYYLQQLGAATSQSKVKGRVVLEYGAGQQTLIISRDGSGSQVDMLVKAPFLQHAPDTNH